MQRPRGVYEKAGRYYKVRKNKWIPLSRVADGEAALLQALAALPLESSPQTVAELLTAYVGHGMSDLRASTRPQYARIVSATLIPVFGHMRVDAVTTGHVAKFLEARKQAGVPAMGNRERSVLSAAYEFGLRRGFAASNPCRGIRRNTERPRRRYIETVELQEAVDAAPIQFARLMYAAYLTGLRQGDLRLLRRADVKPDGLHVTESKTGHRRVITWSAELRKLVDDELQRSKCERVFTNRFGQPWTVWAIQSQRKRAKHGFRFHDIRAKAESDAPGTLGRHSAIGVYVRRQRSKPVA